MKPIIMMKETVILTKTTRISRSSSKFPLLCNKNHYNICTSHWLLLLLIGILTLSESGYLITNSKLGRICFVEANQHYIRRATTERQYPDFETLTNIQTKTGEVIADDNSNTETTSITSTTTNTKFSCPVNTTNSIYHCFDPFALLETEVECHNVTCQWRMNRYTNDSQPDFCQYVYLPTYFNKTTTTTTTSTGGGDVDQTETFVLTTILPDALEPCLLWEMKYGTTGITTDTVDLSILYKTAAPSSAPSSSPSLPMQERIATKTDNNNNNNNSEEEENKEETRQIVFQDEGSDSTVLNILADTDDDIQTDIVTIPDDDAYSIVIPFQAIEINLFLDAPQAIPVNNKALITLTSRHIEKQLKASVPEDPGVVYDLTDVSVTPLSIYTDWAFYNNTILQSYSIDGKALFSRSYMDYVDDEPRKSTINQIIVNAFTNRTLLLEFIQSLRIASDPALRRTDDVYFGPIANVIGSDTSIVYGNGDNKSKGSTNNNKNSTLVDWGNWNDPIMIAIVVAAGIACLGIALLLFCCCYCNNRSRRSKQNGIDSENNDHNDDHEYMNKNLMKKKNTPNKRSSSSSSNNNNKKKNNNNNNNKSKENSTTPRTNVSGCDDGEENNDIISINENTEEVLLVDMNKNNNNNNNNNSNIKKSRQQPKKKIVTSSSTYKNNKSKKNHDETMKNKAQQKQKQNQNDIELPTSPTESSVSQKDDVDVVIVVSPPPPTTTTTSTISVTGTTTGLTGAEAMVLLNQNRRSLKEQRSNSRTKLQPETKDTTVTNDKKDLKNSSTRIKDDNNVKSMNGKDENNKPPAGKVKNKSFFGRNSSKSTIINTKNSDSSKNVKKQDPAGLNMKHDDKTLEVVTYQTKQIVHSAKVEDAPGNNLTIPVPSLLNHPSNQDGSTVQPYNSVLESNNVLYDIEESMYSSETSTHHHDRLNKNTIGYVSDSEHGRCFYDNMEGPDKDKYEPSFNDAGSVYSYLETGTLQSLIQDEAYSVQNGYNAKIPGEYNYDDDDYDDNTMDGTWSVGAAGGRFLMSLSNKNSNNHNNQTDKKDSSYNSMTPVVVEKSLDSTNINNNNVSNAITTSTTTTDELKRATNRYDNQNELSSSIDVVYPSPALFESENGLVRLSQLHQHHNNNDATTTLSGNDFLNDSDTITTFGNDTHMIHVGGGGVGATATTATSSMQENNKKEEVEIRSSLEKVTPTTNNVDNVEVDYQQKSTNSSSNNNNNNNNNNKLNSTSGSASMFVMPTNMVVTTTKKGGTNTNHGIHHRQNPLLTHSNNHNNKGQILIFTDDEDDDGMSLISGLAPPTLLNFDGDTDGQDTIEEDEDGSYRNYMIKKNNNNNNHTTTNHPYHHQDGVPSISSMGIGEEVTLSESRIYNIIHSRNNSIGSNDTNLVESLNSTLNNNSLEYNSDEKPVKIVTTTTTTTDKKQSSTKFDESTNHGSPTASLSASSEETNVISDSTTIHALKYMENRSKEKEVINAYLPSNKSSTSNSIQSSNNSKSSKSPQLDNSDHSKMDSSASSSLKSSSDADTQKSSSCMSEPQEIIRASVAERRIAASGFALAGSARKSRNNHLLLSARHSALLPVEETGSVHSSQQSKSTVARSPASLVSSSSTLASSKASQNTMMPLSKDDHPGLSSSNRTPPKFYGTISSAARPLVTTPPSAGSEGNNNNNTDDMSEWDIQSVDDDMKSMFSTMSSTKKSVPTPVRDDVDYDESKYGTLPTLGGTVLTEQERKHLGLQHHNRQHQDHNISSEDDDDDNDTDVGSEASSGMIESSSIQLPKAYTPNRKKNDETYVSMLIDTSRTSRQQQQVEIDDDDLSSTAGSVMGMKQKYSMNSMASF